MECGYHRIWKEVNGRPSEKSKGQLRAIGELPLNERISKEKM